MKTWNLSYQEAKTRAKEIYARIGTIFSPALGGEAVFARIGFNHLIRKNRIRRSKKEQKRRFALLEYAERIVKNPTAHLKHHE